MANTLLADLRKLKAMKRKEEVAKKRYDKLKAERKEFEFRCLDRMEREFVESVKTGGSLYVALHEDKTVYGTIQDRAKFIEWAKENDEELIVEKEAGDLLNQLVRKRLDDGEPMPPGVGHYSRPYVSIRAA